MKKITLILCILFMSLGLVACGKSSISYAENDVAIYENQVYEINSNDIKIEGKTSDYSIVLLDTNIAEIDGFFVKPKNVGNTTIRLKLNTKKDVHFDISFEVKKGKIAKLVSLQSSLVNIDMSSGVSTALNKITTNEDCDEIPEVTYDSDIISYDVSTGVVTAKKVGSTDVIIKYRFCETKFRVNITEEIYTKLIVLGDNKVYENSSGKLDFQVFPSNANTYTFYLSEKDKNRTDFIVYSDGTYLSYGATRVEINYWYYDAKNHKSSVQSFEVEVIEKITDFDVKVLDENNVGVSNFLLDKNYKININLGSNFDVSNFKITGDLVSKSDITYIENGGFQKEFSFKTSGKNTITIVFEKTLCGVENIVEKTLDFEVSDTSSITIGAKWLSMEIFPDENNMYIIYLDGKDGMRPNQIAIMLKINGEFDTTLKYDVYMQKEVPEKLDSNLFVPTSTGTYTFEVIFAEKSLGNIVVVVLE